MLSEQPSERLVDSSPLPARRRGAGKLIGRLILLAVLGLAFLGYLTPDMRIQWANLMTLCGF